MKVKMKFAQNQVDLLKKHATIVITPITTTPSQTFYFLPYWFEDIGENTFVLHPFSDTQQLPSKLKKAIQDARK